MKVSALSLAAAGALAFVLGCAAAERREPIYPLPTDPRTGEKYVSFLKGLSDEELLRLVPTQPGLRFVDCPNCEAGTQDTAPWEWVPEKPFQIRCKGCGEVYPDNPKYPDDKVLVVEGPDGTEFRFPYYERPDGYRLFFRAAADYERQNYMFYAARALARRYWLTGDEDCARRAALILYRLAQTFPGWPFHFDYPFMQKVFVPWYQNRIGGVPEIRVTRLYYWIFGDLPAALLETYDLIRDWPGLARVGARDAREKIENMFTVMAEHVLGAKEVYYNVSNRLWSSGIAAGRLLHRDDWVLDCVRRMNTMMRTMFHHDGAWPEPSMMYARMSVYHLDEVVSVLKGYEPPLESADEVRACLEEHARLRAAFEDIEDACRLPNGSPIPVNDVWAPRSNYGVPKEKHSRLIPGWQIAMLRRGDAAEPVCAWLHNAPGSGHRNLDQCSIGLYAFGKELLSDIGYTHTKWRHAWARATASHNTVVVNGINSGTDASFTENRIRLFATDGRTFHIVEAESNAAYPGVTSRYRRTLALVGEDSSDAYLIDVFQVHGGRQHDYLLHASSDEPSIARVEGIDMRPYDGTLMNPGTVFVEPKGESEGGEPHLGLWFIKDLSAGRADGEVVLDVRLASAPDVGTRSHLMGGRGTTIYLGRSPQVRPAQENDSELDKYWRPTLCARRQGENLKSVFIAVHEPVKGEGKVSSISARELEDGLLLVIGRGPSDRDYFMMGYEGPVEFREETPDGPLEFSGSWGLARIEGGRCVEAHMIGDRLSAAGCTLTGTAGWCGEVRAVGREPAGGSRGFLDVDGRVDPSATRCALLVEFPDRTCRAYNVVRIEPLAQGTRLRLAETPGFEVEEGKVKLVSFPQRTIEGTRVTWSLPHLSALRPGTAGGIAAPPHAGR